MESLLPLLEPVAGPSGDNLQSVVEEYAQHVLQTQDSGLALD